LANALLLQDLARIKNQQERSAITLGKEARTMKALPSGAYLAKDGETLTLNVTSTGTQTLFGVNYSLGGSGSAITSSGTSTQIKLDKSKATGNSDIPGAKSTVLVLIFSYDSPKGGNYKYTITGASGDPPINADAPQAGALPTEHNFIIHIA